MSTASQENIDRIHSSLLETFASGKTKSKAWRREQLRQAWWMFEDNKERICQAIHEDLHKHRFEAFSADVKSVQDDIVHTYRNLEKWTADYRPSPYSFLNFLGNATVRKEPLGVTLIIGAWNYPFILLFQPMVAAIAAGCAILLKPSEVATASEKLILEIVPKYLDPDAVRCVSAGPAEMSYLLQKRFDHIFFTGSAGVAKIVAAAAAKHLTPLTLELGGQGPAIVTAQANIDLAAKRIASTKFINAGQLCLNVNHVLVDPSVLDEFVSRLKHHFAIFLGGVAAPEYYSSIINVKNFDRLENLLKKTRGTIELAGVRDRDNLIFGPTIVTNVTQEDPIMSEELFGPILPVISVNVDQAIQTVNSMEHPLAMYIFTKSQAEKDKVLNSTLSGGVTINDCLMHAVAEDAPFGGVGGSGYGSYHGSYGVQTFSHLRTILDPPTWMEALISFRYPPYTLQNLNKMYPEGKPPFGRGGDEGVSNLWKWSLAGLAGATVFGGYLYKS